MLYKYMRLLNKFGVVEIRRTLRYNITQVWCEYESGFGIASKVL